MIRTEIGGMNESEGISVVQEECNEKRNTDELSRLHKTQYFTT